MHRFTLLRPVTRRVVSTALLSIIMASAAFAQDNPVYVNDSPAARAMLRQAEDQIRDNPGEAVRLFQTLLDEYSMKLVPVTENATEQFVSVRQRIIRNLRSNNALLERYQLLATPQATRMFQTGQIQRLAVTRALTEPGLQAMLSLAQEEFESAHFDAALIWLQQAVEHPKCAGPYAAHAWYMTAVASYYVNDVTGLQHATAQLQIAEKPGPALLAHLQQIIEDNAAPTLQRGNNVLTRTVTDAVTDLIAQPIWTRQLSESLLLRRFVDPAIPESRHSPVLEQRRREADLLTAAATVCGDLVYINEGYRITAYDRYMGDIRWSFVDLPSLSLLDRDNDPPLDLNIIAVSDSSLVSFTGHAHSDHRSGTGAVVCLDRFTGERRWETRLRGFAGNEGGNLYPHGVPIIADGTVFLLARKVSAQRLASTYAIALDLETGRMRWTRYLTSSGGLHRAGRPISAPVYEHGWLYLSTPIGAIARLDSTTGEISWLHRFGVPINIPFQDQMRRPWEFSAPIITAAGVVAIQPDQRRIVLLDTHTGDVLQTFPATINDAWGEVHYLLADDRQVYAVGRDIRTFPIDSLTHSLWTLPPPATSKMTDDRTLATSTTMQRLDLRGRVQLTDGLLIIPSLHGILFVDTDTGQINHRLPVASGNPVVIDAQLFYAGSDRLDAYMSFDRAQNMLRARIAERPNDPSPALSLLRLAIRVGDMGLALSAADLTNHAVQMDPDPAHSSSAQQELFALLLSINEQELIETPQQAEALYVMLGAVATNSEQRVEYLLAYGDWLAKRDLGQAVEIYQRLLSDTQLAKVPRPDGKLFRNASYWASEKLRTLLSLQGERVYAAQADFAQRQLDGLTAREHVDVEALLALAREFPFAPAATAATQQVVNMYLSRSQQRDALAALIAQYRLTEREKSASALLGQAVELCEQVGWHLDATHILNYVRSQYGDITLNSSTGPRAVEQWQAALEAARPVTPLARQGQPDEPVREIAGTLVQMHPLSQGPQSNDEFIVASESVIQLYDADEREPRWSLDLSQPISAVLAHSEAGILLWAENDKPDAHVIMVEPADGSVRWMSASLEQTLGEALHGMIRATELNEQLPDGSPFDPSQTLPLVCGDRLVLVRRIGQMLAIDTSAGPNPIWKLGITMDQVHYAALTDSSLVLVGVNRARSGRRNSVPVLMVIDPATGRTVRSMSLAGDEPARWIRFGPLGRLVYGSDAGIQAVDLYTSQRAWTNYAYDAVETTTGWLVDNTIVFQERSRQLRAIDLDTGKLSDPFDMPIRSGSWDPYELQDVVIVNDRIYALYPRRVVRYSTAGRVFGQDVITGERDYRWLIPTKNELLLISASSTQSPIPDEAGRRLQYTYRIYQLSPNGQLLGDAVDLPAHTVRVNSVRALNNWLVLGLAEPVTRLVPMPADDQMP